MGDPNKTGEMVPHTPSQAELEALADSFGAQDPEIVYTPPPLEEKIKQFNDEQSRHEMEAE